MTLHWYQSLSFFCIIFSFSLIHYVYRYSPPESRASQAQLFSIFVFSMPLYISGFMLWYMSSAIFTLTGILLFFCQLDSSGCSEPGHLRARAASLAAAAALVLVTPVLAVSGAEPSQAWNIYALLFIPGITAILLRIKSENFSSMVKSPTDLFRLVFSHTVLVFIIFGFYIILWRNSLKWASGLPEYTETIKMLLLLLIFITLRPVEKKARIMAERFRGVRGAFLITALSDLSKRISHLMEPLELAGNICSSISSNLDDIPVFFYVDKRINALLTSKDSSRNDLVCLCSVGNQKEPDEKSYAIPLKIKISSGQTAEAAIVMSGASAIDEELAEALKAFSYHASSAFSNALLYFDVNQLNSKLKQALTRLEKTQKELVQSEKLAAVGRLSAQIAHEVRNPLGTIKVSAFTLRDSLGSDENMKTLSDFIICEVERLNDVVSGLLDFSRPRTITPEPVSITDLKREIHLRIDPISIDRNIKFTVKTGKKPQEWTLDMSALIQVIYNLAINAMDAVEDAVQMPHGRDMNQGEVTVNIDQADHELVISVTDNGPGFTVDADKLFEPFFTGKTRGNGLGLSICRQIVELHHGSMKAKNRPDTSGAEFVITIPDSAS